MNADYDIVLANYCLTTWPILLARVPAAKRFYYIQADEAEYYADEKRPILQFLARSSYRLPFEQIVNAPVYFDHPWMRAREFVPPGVDLETFHPKPIRRDMADGKPIVLGCIGRREPSKGTEYVLAAFEALAASDPRFRLRVAYGNLPESWSHPALEIIIPRSDAELADFYRSVDIMIAAGTVQHGAPHYPVMEAMACATPVVTTGYLPADGRNSWIVPNRNSAAITDAVRAIVADPGYGARVARSLEAIQPFRWGDVAAKMAAIFARKLAQ